MKAKNKKRNSCLTEMCLVSRRIFDRVVKMGTKRNFKICFEKTGLTVKFKFIYCKFGLIHKNKIAI